MKLRLSILFALLISIAFVFYSCKKDQPNPVPYVYTDFYLYTNNPSLVNLIPGGFIYVDNQGARGIIVYCRSTGEYVAFDRNCTYDPSQSCATIKVAGNSGIQAVDSCCKSTFNIYDGSVLKGPATRALRQYNVFFDQQRGSIHIYN